MKAIVVVLFFSALCLTAVAQMTDKQWQAKAIEKYPALAVQGSELNKRFIDAYTNRRKTNPRFFTNPQWPLILANELAAASPAPSIEPSTPRPPEPPTAIAATPQPTEKTDSSFPGDVILIAIVGVVGLIIWASAAIRPKPTMNTSDIDAARRRGTVPRTSSAWESDKRILPALLLCLILGPLGAHRFYVNRGGSGFLLLLSCFIGVGVIWWLFDLYHIIVGAFTDGQGRQITKWT